MNRRAKLLVVVFLAALVLPQTGGATQTPKSLRELAPAAAKVTDLARDLRATAREFSAGATIAAQMETTFGLAGARAPASIAAAPVTFVEAMTNLYKAAGVRAPAVTSLPQPAVAAAVAPLIAATAQAVTLTNQALARITPSERRWALQHLDAFETPWTAESRRVADIAGRVDLTKMQLAALGIANAIDRLPRIDTAASAWIDPTGAVEIGSTGADYYQTDRVLIVDLGGNDTHADAAGAIGPVISNTLGLPVSVTVDLGGDDQYYIPAANQPENTIVAQGAGLGGVGLLVDRWGNDYYNASLYSTSNAACVGDVVFGGYPGRFPQITHAQGAGALGVGGLVDLSGTDYMINVTYINTPNNCHFNRSYAHGQGAGLQKGVGILIDDTGNDYRYLHALARGFPGYSGAQDFVAGVYGQGFAAGGVGLLADKEGDDYNFAQSWAQWSYDAANKGAFATTFAQGAVAGLLHAYGTDRAVSLGVPGDVCGGGAAGSQGGSAKASPCQMHGVALHVDLLGTDTFDAGAYSIQGNVNQCTVGSVAIAAGQGGAGWGGIASLLDLDAEGADTFSLHPYAEGGPCYSDNTRAHAYGQGFGGAVRYPIWDDPNAWYAGVDSIGVSAAVATASLRPALPAIGILVSGGPACPPGPATIAVDPTTPDASASCPPALDAPTSSPDAYYANPYAYNPQGIADAQAWVQGSGGLPHQTSFALAGVLPAALGIGALVDAGGDDTYRSAPYAGGTAQATATSVAQGATRGGIGVLADLLGNDSYYSAPSSTGAADSLHQGDARAGFGEPISPIAVLADGGGKDSYGPSITCQANGALPLAWALWGTLSSPTCGAQPGTFILGLDTASGIAL